MIDPAEFDAAVRPGLTALVAQMQAHGTARDEPVRSTMGLLGDRWSALILLVLETGIWRHAELRRTLALLSAEQAISQRVLTLKLRALERDGFVWRAASEHVPPQVSYGLTRLGDELVKEARRMIAWIGAHRTTIETAREAFDRAD